MVEFYKHQDLHLLSEFVWFLKYIQLYVSLCNLCLNVTLLRFIIFAHIQFEYTICATICCSSGCKGFLLTVTKKKKKLQTWWNYLITPVGETLTKQSWSLKKQPVFSVSMFPQNKSSLGWEALWALYYNLATCEWDVQVFSSQWTV